MSRPLPNDTPRDRGENDAKELGKLMDPNVTKEEAILLAYTFGYNAGMEEADRCNSGNQN